MQTQSLTQQHHIEPITYKVMGVQVYEELDEEVQKAFEGYLRERGVDEGLGAFLLAAVNDKEQREYVAWLARVEKFLRH